MSQNFEKDMTKGPIVKHLVLFALPLFLGGFVQLMYTITDAYVVGHYAGKVAFGALDSLLQLIRLPIAFFMGMATATTILIGQAYGAGNNEKVKKIIHSTLLCFGILGLVFSVGGVILSPSIIHFMNVPPEMVAHSQSYIQTLFAGLIFMLLYNMGNGIMRALGDSRRPFVYLCIGCVLNIFLDIFFVSVLDMGTRGAALATVLCNGFSMVLTLNALRKLNPEYNLRFHRLKFNFDVLPGLILTGLPISLEIIIYPLTNGLIQREINIMGTNVIAAWALAAKCDVIIWIFMDAITSSLSTFVAQNIGAGAFSRAKKGVNSSLILGASCLFATSVVIFFVAPSLARFFINDQQVVNLTVRMLRHYFIPFYLIFFVGSCYMGAVRATGQTFLALIISFISLCLLRLIWVFIFVPLHPSIEFLILCYPGSWFLLALCAIFAQRKALWHRKDIPVQNPDPTQ